MILGIAALVSSQHKFSSNPDSTAILTSFIVMIAETIALGILSLPSVVATIGLVPYVFGIGITNTIFTSDLCITAP